LRPPKFRTQITLAVEHSQVAINSAKALIELACTWTQAAVQSEHIFGVNDSPPEHRAL
jgi:hypothetical protein